MRLDGVFWGDLALPNLVHSFEGLRLGYGCRPRETIQLSELQNYQELKNEKKTRLT